jgi:hypothetical protein
MNMKLGFGENEVSSQRANSKVAHKNGRKSCLRGISNQRFSKDKSNLGDEFDETKPRNNGNIDTQTSTGADVWHRPGFPGGTILAIVSGVIILIMLGFPWFSLGYYDSGIPFQPTSGYDVALGSIQINGVWMSTYQGGIGILGILLIWLIIAGGVTIIALGWLSIPSSTTRSEKSLRTRAEEHSGTIIAITGLLISLFCLLMPYSAIVGYTVYSEGIVLSTWLAELIMGGVAFFSGLEIRRGYT